MNWDAIAAVGELTGAVAVVISLLYLASEIRTSNKAAKLAASREIMDEYSQIYAQLATDSDTAKLWLRGCADDPSLNQAEIFQFRMLLIQAVTVWERLFYLNKSNEIDEWFNDGLVHLRQGVCGAPGFQRWFADRSGQISPEFKKVLQREIEESTGYHPQGLNVTPEQLLTEFQNIKISE